AQTGKHRALLCTERFPAGLAPIPWTLASMTDNVALPHLSSCAACQIGAKLACRIHLRRLCCFHLHSFADACFPFNPSRTLFHQLVGFYQTSKKTSNWRFLRNMRQW